MKVGDSSEKIGLLYRYGNYSIWCTSTRISTWMYEYSCEWGNIFKRSFCGTKLQYELQSELIAQLGIRLAWSKVPMWCLFVFDFWMSSYVCFCCAAWLWGHFRWFRVLSIHWWSALRTGLRHFLVSIPFSCF